jgi:hypothetical protein
MSAPTQFQLPDPLAHWPWPRALNPYYAEVKPQSDTWLRSFEALGAKSQRSFDRCNFGKYSDHFVNFFVVDYFELLQPFSVVSHIHLSTKVSPYRDY